MAGLNTNEWSWLPSLGQPTPQDMPTDDATAQLMLKRRLAQADLLKNAEMPQGQMVSGHYVAPSWTQYLANIANQYVGGKEAKEVEHSAEKLRKKHGIKGNLYGHHESIGLKEDVEQIEELADLNDTANEEAVAPEETGMEEPAVGGMEEPAASEEPAAGEEMAAPVEEPLGRGKR